MIIKTPWSHQRYEDREMWVKIRHLDRFRGDTEWILLSLKICYEN